MPLVLRSVSNVLVKQPQPVERSVSNESIKAVELFELAENTLSSDIEPPPPYDASFKDIPPPYTSHHLFPKEHLPLQPSSDIFIVFEKAPNFCLCPMTAPGIDFGEVPNLRQAAGKKKNKKSGNQSKAADSGDEGNKNPGEGETNGGADGGEGGGSNNGDGGAGGEGGGDGGGDEWNDWNMTKKKKGKKGKNNVEEEEKKKEEEEKKKMEEEKKKEEEEELAKAGDPLSWANGGDADPDDEWGNFIEKKGKKGKKAKVR